VKHKLILILVVIPSFLLGTMTYAQDDPAFISEDVTFTNGDVTLVGTLTLPDTPGPHPAAIVISGSGEQDRNGAVEGFIEGYEPLRFLAEALTPAGIAILRYDERSIGESTGVHHTSTTEDFANDAQAAFDYLAAHDDIDAEQIGLIGHSEGSNIVAYAAARNEDVAFVISMAGQAVDGYDVLVEQTVQGALANGASEQETEAALEAGQIEWDMVLNEDWDGLEVYTRQLLSAMPVEHQPDPEELDAMIAYQEEFAKSWFRFFLEYNPAEDWAQIDAPILVILAELDTQITVAQNLEPFAEALEDGETPNYDIVVLEDTNHLFQPDVETGAPSEYAELEPAFTPELPTLLRDWILDHVTLA